MDIKGILSWVVNAKLIPSGWMTKASGWLGIVSSVACMIGHPLPFIPCPDATTSLIAGLGLVGLGRRGTV